MATQAGQLHELDEENDRVLRERKELEGDGQVSPLGISARQLPDILTLISGAHSDRGRRGLPGVKVIA